MDLFEAIKKRASVRSFAPAHVSDVEIERILDAGRRAPSGNNAQPCSYIVIKSRGTIQKLAKVQSCIGEASVAIGVVADPGVSKWWVEDASAATENMLLAITALGYDSLWVEGTLLRQEEYAKALLGIPADLRLIVLLPIGKATSPVEQMTRKPLSDLVHYEKW